MARSALRIKSFGNEKAFIEKSVKFISKICSAKKGIIRIALSGGSTPQKIYQTLAHKKKIPFHRTEFFIVDERFVPLNHPDSNYRMIFRSLVKHIQNKLRCFHFFNTALPLKKCLEKYENRLKKIKFDLIILGIGHDGHIASLFPRCKALSEKKKLTAHTTTTKFAAKNRLTITFPAILRSTKILVLLKGQEKKPVLNELLQGKKKYSKFPAKKLLDHKNVTIHYLPK